MAGGPALSIHLSNHDSARDVVRAAARAEAHGVRRVWLSEDLFYRGAMPTAAAVLATTERIQVGFGVLVPQHRHPASLAMDIRSLLDLGSERVIVGLGAGVAARAELIGQPASPPLRIVAESVAAVRELLAGGELHQDALLHRSQGVRLTGTVDTPVPPVYVAAVGPKALRQAGAEMDGAVLTLMCSREHAAWAAGQIAEAAAEAGRASVPVVAYLPISVDADSAVAKDRARAVLASYIARWAGLGYLSRLFTDWSDLDDARMAAIKAAVHEGGDLRDLVPDDLVDQFCIAGTPEQCHDLVAAFGAAGITEIAFEPGDDIDSVLAFIRDEQARDA